MLATLAALGSSFLCANDVELALVRALVPSSRLLCAAAARDAATALDASTFVVDSLDELRAVLASVPAARVLLRLQIDDVSICDDDDGNDDVNDGSAFTAPLSTRVGLNLQVNYSCNSLGSLSAVL